MITIITGVPGAGKTAYVVAQLLSESRPLFCMGIPELSVVHQPVPPLSEWTEERPVPEDPSLSEHYFIFPPNSLVVIDEAQKILRPRASSAKVPPYVQAYETHRHQGLDFILLTQSPTLLDSNVRRLCGRHIHLRVTWAGRRLYEWSECVSPDSPGQLSRATTRPYTLPKAAFSAYRSAEVHTVQVRRKPWQLAALAAIVLAFVLLGYRMSDRIGSTLSGDVPEVASDSLSSDRLVLPPSVGNVSAQGVEALGARVEDYQPRLPQRPETAPLYDTLRVPRDMPRVAGCLSFRGQCRCVTQQGTDAFLSGPECEAWLARPPFDPWRLPPPVSVPADSGPFHVEQEDKSA